MFKNQKKFLFTLSLMLICTLNIPFAYADKVININASDLVPRAEISVTPAQATIVEDSIFEVPILLNTKGQSMNTIELNLKFDPTKLSIVKPSTGKSIIGIWVQPPKYDNTKGTANFAGTIPGGIVSNSSLIITITFQAKGLGTTDVRVLDSSSVLANDGVGTQAVLTSSRGVFTVLPKPPGGLTIYSDTHPFQDHWYNNNSPTLAWNRDPGIIGFSYVLDDKPNTIPNNENLINETSKSYQNLNDGLWYFHIKALRGGGAWGTTTNYIFRIDTTAPAKFSPKVNYLTEDNINRALVTFFSTDSLSGIDHYEIGVIDKTQAETSSPLFVRSESSYQVPFSAVTNSRVIVRAYDTAGNSTDVQVSVRPPSAMMRWITDNSSIILLLLLILIILLYLIHYLWGHKVLKKLRLVSRLLNDKKEEDIEEVVKEVEEEMTENEKGKEQVSTPEIKTVVPVAKTEAPKIEPKVEEIKVEEVKPEVKIEPKVEEPKQEVKIEEKKEGPKIEPKIEEIKPEVKEEIKIEPKIEIPVLETKMPEPVIKEVKIEPPVEILIPEIKVSESEPKKEVVVEPIVNLGAHDLSVELRREELGPAVKEEIKIEPKIEAKIEEPIIIPTVEPEMEVPKPPVQIEPKIEIPEIAKQVVPEIPKIEPIKIVDEIPNNISMQSSMIKDKLSKPIVTFQKTVE